MALRIRSAGSARQRSNVSFLRRHNWWRQLWRLLRCSRVRWQLLRQRRRHKRQQSSKHPVADPHRPTPTPPAVRWRARPRREGAVRCVHRGTRSAQRGDAPGCRQWCAARRRPRTTRASLRGGMRPKRSVRRGTAQPTGSRRRVCQQAPRRRRVSMWSLILPTYRRRGRVRRRGPPRAAPSTPSARAGCCLRCTPAPARGRQRVADRRASCQPRRASCARRVSGVPAQRPCPEVDSRGLPHGDHAPRRQPDGPGPRLAPRRGRGRGGCPRRVGWTAARGTAPREGCVMPAIPPHAVRGQSSG